MYTSNVMELSAVVTAMTWADSRVAAHPNSCHYVDPKVETGPAVT
jgi:ribonuclease HI